jgi:chemotaxis protein CheD
MQSSITYQTHFLYPSAIYVHKQPHRVTTILGSCVAVCLWDSVHHFGGVNHFMLPLWNGQGLASPKYGNIAIGKLIDKMLQLGSKKGNLKAKIFGGSQRLETTVSSMEIGKRNILLAQQYLQDEKIPIISSSLGGNKGRKIIFHTETGDVMMKFIS